MLTPTAIHHCKTEIGNLAHITQIQSVILQNYKIKKSSVPGLCVPEDNAHSVGNMPSELVCGSQVSLKRYKLPVALHFLKKLQLFRKFFFTVVFIYRPTLLDLSPNAFKTLSKGR